MKKKLLVGLGLFLASLLVANRSFAQVPYKIEAIFAITGIYNFSPADHSR